MPPSNRAVASAARSTIARPDCLLSNDFPVTCITLVAPEGQARSSLRRCLLSYVPHHGFSGLYQASANPPEHRLQAVSRPGFLHESRQVVLDCRRLHIKVCCHLTVGHALGQQSEHFQLPRGQGDVHGSRSGVRHMPGCTASIRSSVGVPMLSPSLAWRAHAGFCG